MNRFEYNLQRNNYLVIAKEEFVRDSQVAPTKWIETDGTNDYEDWLDIQGPVILGKVNARHGEEAIDKIAKSLGVNKKALHAHKL